MKRSRTNRGWHTAQRVIGLLLAAVALVLSIRQVSWPALAEVIAQAEPAWLILALLAVLLTTGLKATRWYVLLRRCRPRADLVRFARLLFIGQLANTLFPRLGDVVRGVWLGPAIDGGAPAVFGSLVVEKALDGLLGLTVLLGLVIWTPLPAWLQQPLAGLAAVTGALLVALLAARASRVRLAAVVRRLPAGLGERIGRLASDFLLGLDLLRTPADAWLATLLSAGIWILAVVTNILVMRGLDITTPSWTAWLVVVTVYVATFLPTVPAQMGIFEYAAILAMQAGGAAPEPALAFALIVHLAVQGLPGVLGPVSMAIEGIEWQGLRTARRALERDRVA